MADLRIAGGRVVSTFTGEVFEADVLVTGEVISGVVPPGAGPEAAEVIDAGGRLIVPGFVDAHMHVESSFTTPAAFAWLTLPRGTTTVLADPHEIVNVAGKAAMRWMIEEGARSPQTQLWGVPSCVPALAGMEYSGAHLDPEDIDELLGWDGVSALAEVMDYRAVVAGDQRMHDIVRVARERGTILDGHCPNLSGEELSAYLATGIDSDHTKNTPEVAVEKARLGMTVMLQEKCLLPEVVGALTALPQLPPLCLVTDDLAADHIAAKGHLDHIGRKAVEAGLPALDALRALTWNPAQRLRKYDRGVVAPSKRADLLLLDGELADFAVHTVIAGGAVVARGGTPTYPEPEVTHPFAGSVQIAEIDPDEFRWRLNLPDGTHRFRALQVNPVDTYTQAAEVSLEVVDGEVRWEGEVALLWVRNRHGRPNTSCVPVIGMSLAEGALTTTYAHDSHNFVTLGTSRRAMRATAEAVLADDGGVAVAHAEGVVARLSLAVGGVMSAEPTPKAVAGSRRVREALEAWGWRHANPFMSVSTLTLAVSPSVKITDLGLVDVLARDWTPQVLDCCH
ncbi:adenine deaminase [Saccharopolyspora antimicrobica]|uniref:Adenine deaminase n=1 Tax=Saccharopolyspora antimicrobica TaxID=455193 RepID=A0A1I5IQ13_9PSEU|nr:adenine deaminase C-terminal domain-containing protein [Saccharopolyspora antimicrobica]RKT84099.1 adenine deaminase [Saccharopolyspora antimicrobica]SFO62532.1 adenine deaminase [Saccharopolyspora antimicrobica]